MSYETHYARYDELQKTYKIKYGLTTAEREAIEQYDIVVERAGTVYAGAKWRVLRNKPNLSNRDLAIICDKGNLCFGYRSERSFDGSTIIVVYTD